MYLLQTNDRRVQSSSGQRCFVPEKTVALELTDPQSIFADCRTSIGFTDMADQPVILAGRRVNWAATNWLRYLRENGRKPSSIETYRAVLQDFLIAVYDSDLTWAQVDDSFLREWRENLISDRGIKKATFNDYLDTVIRFYRWAQEAHWVENIVGEGISPAGLPYPISLKVRSPNKPDGLVSKVKFDTERESVPAMPSPDVLEDINCEIATGKADERLIERDLLMMELYRKLGLRRSEALRLTGRQLPSLASIEAMIEAGKTSDDPYEGLGYRVVISRSKRGGIREIIIPLELLRRLREWIDGPRREIISELLSRGIISSRPAEIFVSAKTGKALSGRAVTNLYTLARGRAAVRVARQRKVVRSPVPHGKARLHHLRHMAITDQYIARRMAGMDEAFALALTREFAGHAPGSRATEIYVHVGDRLLPERIEEERRLAAQRDSDVRARWIDDAALAAGGRELIAIHGRLRDAVRKGVVSPAEIEAFLASKASGSPAH
jgi:integrase